MKLLLLQSFLMAICVGVSTWNFSHQKPFFGTAAAAAFILPLAICAAIKEARE